MTSLSFGKPGRELLSRKQAAAYLGVSENTLAVWKCTNRYNLPMIKVGRLAKYDRADLDRWLLSRTTDGLLPVTKLQETKQ